MSKSQKTNTELMTSFTIDIGSNTQNTASVPSITRLLNRKSPSLKKDSTSLKLSFVESQGLSQGKKIPEVKISPQAPIAAPIAEISGPKIQSTQRQNRNIPQLIHWELSQLMKSQDPLAKAIIQIFQKGAMSSLFLSIQAPSSGAFSPFFQASAIVQALNKEEVWTGLKWNPALTPEVWNQFIKNGFIELSPPGTLTNQKSNRNIIRTAFGIHSSEWLLLLRVGPAQACRGVLAVVSKKTLAVEISEILNLIHTENAKTVAKVA